MNKISIIAVIWLLQCAEAKTAKHVTLQDAICRKLISGTGKGLGGYQGYCVELQLRSLVPDSLVIAVEPGRRLKAEASEYQDILIVKSESVLLKGKGTATLRVYGFCCERTDSSPPAGSKFALNAMADSNLIKLAAHLNAGHYGDGLTQSAVWAISNGLPTGGICSLDEPAGIDLRRMVSDLKGEEFPWYTIGNHSFVSRAGVIHTIRHSLKGTLNYSLPETKYVSCVARDSTGMPVGIIRSDWLTATRDGQYDLDLPVKTLAAGKYSVELVTHSGDVIARRSFEL